MKFYCKKCNTKFDEDYEDLFEHLKCPSCKNKETVLNFIVQDVLPPEKGFGISFFEFEDLLEEGKITYLKDFFREEFDLQFSRTGYEFSLLDKMGKEADIKEIHNRTQKDGKLQRVIYNIYYVLLQGM